MTAIRQTLVELALKWEKQYGVAPSITSALAEYDAAMCIGCSEEEYSKCMQGRTAVSRGHDFVHNKYRYQVTGNRPSGKPGSKVTLVSKKKKYDWDYFIWVHYFEDYRIREIWQWSVDDYRQELANKKRHSPNDIRKGKRLK